MSELNSEVINRLAREAGMTRAVGPKRNAWHGWEHELEEFANLVAKHARDTGIYAWCIEGAWSPTAAPEYWAGSSAWSSDHMRAIRFARQEDAQQAADMMLDGINVRICEHAWRPRPTVQPDARYLCQHPGDCSVRDGVCPHCPERATSTTPAVCTCIYGSPDAKCPVHRT